MGMGRTAQLDGEFSPFANRYVSNNKKFIEWNSLENESNNLTNSKTKELKQCFISICQNQHLEIMHLFRMRCD